MAAAELARLCARVGGARRAEANARPAEPRAAFARGMSLNTSRWCTWIVTSVSILVRFILVPRSVRHQLESSCNTPSCFLLVSTMIDLDVRHLSSASWQCSVQENWMPRRANWPQLLSTKSRS